MAEFHLNVHLPKNRNKTGLMEVKKNGKTLGTFNALGRGSKGPGQTQFKTNGNTPSGTYKGTHLIDTKKWPQRSFGPNGAIRLKALSGDAIKAENLGRDGLLIHGGTKGRSDYWRGKGALRATNGCIRLSNEDIKKLMEMLYGAAYANNMCNLIDITISVKEH